MLDFGTLGSGARGIAEYVEISPVSEAGAQIVGERGTRIENNSGYGIYTNNVELRIPPRQRLTAGRRWYPRWRSRCR